MHKVTKMRKAALATGRLIVPISPSDKRKIERKASAGRMSIAEFVRRAALQYDRGAEPRLGKEALLALLDAFGAAHAQTLARLDRRDAVLAYFAAKTETAKLDDRTLAELGGVEAIPGYLIDAIRPQECGRRPRCAALIWRQ
jgi:hypothetical protein